MEKKEGTKEKKLTQKEIDQALLDNFINLQRVLTNLSIKFEDLSGNISKLLQVFEISAKNFAEKYNGNTNETADKSFLERLDKLLDQNKTISKGIMLMEEKIRERQNTERQSSPESRLRDMYKSRSPQGF